MGKSIPVESMKELINISRKYGSDSDYVLAGGGNTSWKSDDLMAVKASGAELGSITEDGFVMLSMGKLKVICTKQYPENREERENQALKDLMDSRLAGEQGRPSVESLLHGIIPEKIIVHTHPAIVNALTCSKGGKDKADALFPDRCIWIPFVDPGYILAKTVNDRLAEWKAAHNGLLPEYIFLQNHGVFLWGSIPEEIDKKSKNLLSTLSKECEYIGPVKIDTKESVSDDFLQKVGRLAGSNGDAIFTTGKEIKSALSSNEDLYNLRQSLTPDHIVYMGHTPMVYENISEEQLIGPIENDYMDFTEKWGKEPRSILIHGKGFISVGNSKKSARNSRLLMLDAIRVIRVSHAFEGPQFMTEENVNFINAWEVEKYRSKMSDKG